MTKKKSRFVLPEVFLVGYTGVDLQGIKDYLKATDQEEFLKDWVEAMEEGVQPGEALVSMFAKMCYRSLVLGKNANIGGVRSIPDNIKAVMSAAHGSVLEHASINFIVTNCSRIFTHELVRHRVGTAFSQTSGRYVRAEPGEWELVAGPLAEKRAVRYLLEDALESLDVYVYLLECELGLRVPNEQYPKAGARECLDHEHGFSCHEHELETMWRPVKSHEMPFSLKKKLTSAVRRILPNGLANEIAVTLNVRALRHTIQMRTSRHSEWEIRYVFEKIYRLCKQKWPLFFSDAEEAEVDGLLEVTGMRMLPYEKAEGSVDSA